MFASASLEELLLAFSNKKLKNSLVASGKKSFVLFFVPQVKKETGTCHHSMFTYHIPLSFRSLTGWLPTFTMLTQIQMKSSCPPPFQHGENETPSSNLRETMQHVWEGRGDGRGVSKLCAEKKHIATVAWQGSGSEPPGKIREGKQKGVARGQEPWGTGGSQEACTGEGSQAKGRLPTPLSLSPTICAPATAPVAVGGQALI